MSTRSNVGIKKGNKIKYIYVHFDGYPLGVGRILREYYTDPKKVKKLISLGDCSVLGCELSPAKENFDDTKWTNPNGSLFYGRDRGEGNTKAVECDWDVYVRELANDNWIEYVYVFEDGEWTGYKNHFEYKVNGNDIELTGHQLVKVNVKEYEDA